VEAKLAGRIAVFYVSTFYFGPKGFVCELSFGGEGKGRKGLWRGKPLFGSFKKIVKCFGGF